MKGGINESKKDMARMRVYVCVYAHSQVFKSARTFVYNNDVSRSQLICPGCKHEMEDEVHVLFDL